MKKQIRTNKKPLNLYANGGFAGAWKSAGGSGQASAIGGATNLISGITSDIVGGKGPDITKDLEKINEFKTNTAVTSSANINAASSLSSNDEIMNNYSTFGRQGTMDKIDLGGAKINGGAIAGSAAKGAATGAMAGTSIMPGIGTAIGAVVGFIGGGLGKLFGEKKKVKDTKKKQNLLDTNVDEANAAAEEANRLELANVNNAVDRVSTTSSLTSLANYSAYGGHLFSSGGTIHINPKNKGKFNATKKATGKSTEELTHSKNPLTRKRAIFAQNAAKWNKKAEGGDLNTHGGEFSNGVTKFGNGGTHENNPNEGIPQGIGANGLPNLVEEGEVKFNDYIFSNRLFADKKELKNMGLPNYKNHSFAKIAEKLSKESKERPNDPISNNGLIASLGKLKNIQEQLKQSKGISSTNTFKDGGKMGNMDLSTMPVEAYSNTSPNSIINNIASDTTTKDKFSWLDSIGNYMRYAPIIGSAIGVGNDLFGSNKKPDYSNADIIANSKKEVGFNPVGNYMTYNPLDPNYLANKINAQSGATRRALENSSGGNRGALQAGLLAADYNAQGQLGNAIRQGEESNIAQRMKVEEFNRGTNMFNSEGMMKADSINSEQALKRAIAVAQLREDIMRTHSATKSANLSNLFDNIGDIGKENTTNKMIKNNPALAYWMDNVTGKINFKKK